MKHHSLVLILLVISLLAAGTLLWAQEQTPPVQSASQPQIQPPPQLLSPQQLNNLVAPIALYPDPLLGQILVASTYPLEVVEASQWLQRNNKLRGQQLLDAAKQQPWDPSVQALVAVPDALSKLNQDIAWTIDLGNAFLAQEADVMNAVQLMRAGAQARGNLRSTPQQTVTTEARGGQQIIIIEPADPQIIYVPSYDPVYVWGPPVYGYYPPLYYPGFGFSFGLGFNFGFCFGGWNGWAGWGWGPNWFGQTVYINNSFFPHYGFHHHPMNGFGGRTNWAHDPGHRLGVPYADQQVAARFQGPSMASRNSIPGGTGSRSAAVPFANRSAGSPREQGSHNIAPQPQLPQSSTQQGYQTQRYQAPQQSRQAPVRTYQAPQQRYQAPVRSYQAPQQRSQAPVQSYQAPQQRSQAPVQSSRAPQQRSQAPVQSYQAPQQRYQAPVRSYQAPQQRYQAPVQSYQAAQQFRAAPQISAPRFSSGGSFSSGRVSSGGSFSSGRVSSGGSFSAGRVSGGGGFSGGRVSGGGGSRR
jgi:hypothetical protein